MGGLGSGWRISKKDVVEDCLVLSVDDLVSKDIAVPGGWRQGVYNWRYPGQEPPLAAIRFALILWDEGRGRLCLEYDSYGEHVSSRISLVSTTLHFGGRRWWFKCPVKGIRVGKLYLPPGAIHFASRQAHDLTYKSCQQSGQSNRFWRTLARDLGRDEAELRAEFGK
jgi:hypothetical protein